MMQLLFLLFLLEQLCVINYKYYHVHGRRVTTHLPMVSRSRGRYYSPDFGYEVYWPGGEWVQFRDPDLSSTTQPPMVCGRECHYLYRDIKKVCGRHDDNRKFRGCWNYGRCTGYPPDYYEDGYQTFDTYCQFLDRECRSGSGSRPFHSRKYYHSVQCLDVCPAVTFKLAWFFVHLGACERQQNRTFKPMFTDEPVKRMKFYLTSVADTFKKLGRTPCEEPKIIPQIIG